MLYEAWQMKLQTTFEFGLCLIASGLCEYKHGNGTHSV